MSEESAPGTKPRAAKDTRLLVRSVLRHFGNPSPSTVASPWFTASSPPPRRPSIHVGPIRAPDQLGVVDVEVVVAILVDSGAAPHVLLQQLAR